MPRHRRSFTADKFRKTSFYWFQRDLRHVAIGIPHHPVSFYSRQAARRLLRRTKSKYRFLRGRKKARPQLYACARKAFAKRRSRQNLLHAHSFPHNKNFPPDRGFISKGAHETRGNRLQNALFMRIVRAGTNFFLYRPHYPLPPHPITAPLCCLHIQRARAYYIIYGNRPFLSLAFSLSVSSARALALARYECIIFIIILMPVLCTFNIYQLFLKINSRFYSIFHIY